MAEGSRDFIIILGAQGFGKSVWTKAYAAPKPRLLLYDPKAEYPRVDYMSDPHDWIPGVVKRETPAFRYGTFHTEEIEMFGSAAYASGNSTFVMEECAMLFDRGENVAPWARPLIYMGREIGVNVLLVAQRATTIPIGIRSQASRVVTFMQTEPSDVKAMAERIGREWADQIPTLPPLECLDWQAGAGVRRYNIRP